MDENLQSKEINILPDTELKETLKNENDKIASMSKPELDKYRDQNSKYELTHGNVSLLYFGAKRTYDPRNPQFQKIQETLSSFEKDKVKSSIVVLVEGFVPKISDDITQDIHRTGETGFTAHTANSLGLRVECIEPDRKEEVQHLLQHFQPDEIEYYYYLRAVRDFFIKANIHGGKTFEQYSAEMLSGHKRRFGDLPEFSDFDFSFEHMKEIHHRITGEMFDEHRMLSVNPRSRLTIINAVAQECSSFRDFSHVRNIEKYLQQGYSVFIVIGSDHAVIQKPALEKMLKE